MNEEDWMKEEMEKRGQTMKKHDELSHIDIKEMNDSVESWTDPSLENYETQVKRILEEVDQTAMQKLGFTTKEQLEEYRRQKSAENTAVIQKMVDDYAQLNASKNNLVDEEERITSIIYSDPELRELYTTNKDEAILQAKIRMFENAELDSVPLTSIKESEEENYSPRM